MSADTPLWQILGWERIEARGYTAIETPNNGLQPEEVADRYVTETHLLDWLAERCRYGYVRIERYRGRWTVIAHH